MGETRVDLQHLLEDLRDAYTGPLEDTILTEILANLDQRSSSGLRACCRVALDRLPHRARRRAVARAVDRWRRRRARIPHAIPRSVGLPAQGAPPRETARHPSPRMTCEASCEPAHRPRTTSIPWRSCATCFDASRPARSVRSDRSRAMICETFATESFGKPVAFAGSSVLPGAPAQMMLLVRGTHTTVAIRLRFRWFP